MGPWTHSGNWGPTSGCATARWPRTCSSCPSAPGRSPGFEEVAFFHRPSRTLLLEDVLQSHGFHRGRPLVNGLIRVGGIAHPGGVPRDIRAITRRREARAWLEKVLSWDFGRVVMAHGPVVEDGARVLVERAFSWLRPS
ncbi:MAG TPA: hypothetical protein GX013_05730 [Propionibacterium sp.]|nr:hypothetical protein [Propionibacterium sp.]